MRLTFKYFLRKGAYGKEAFAGLTKGWGQVEVKEDGGIPAQIGPQANSRLYRFRYWIGERPVTFLKTSRKALGSE